MTDGSRISLSLSLSGATAALALALSAAPAEACTIMPRRTPHTAAETERLAREAVQRAQAVFEFEVVESDGAGDATIRVLQSVRGPYAVGAILPARPVDGAACGPGRLVAGRRHLLFLSVLPRAGEPVVVWRLASPAIRAALVRLRLMDR